MRRHSETGRGKDCSFETPPEEHGGFQTQVYVQRNEKSVISGKFVAVAAGDGEL